MFRHDMGNFRKDLKDSGFDGLIINDMQRGKTDNTVYVALDKEQIKSAITKSKKVEINQPENKTTPIEDKGNEPIEVGKEKPEIKQGKYEAKARKLVEDLGKKADKVPSWLINKDPNIKSAGLDNNSLLKILGEATIEVGKLMDKGIDFADAIKRGADKLIDDYKNSFFTDEAKKGNAKLTPDFENKLRQGFEQHYKENIGEPEKTENSGQEPPPETPKNENVKTDEEDDGFSSIKKDKLSEIKGAKKLFEKQKVIKWNDTYDKGLENVQKMYPEKSLYDAMRARLNHFVGKLERKEIFNPTSEDNAVFNVLMNDTLNRLKKVTGIDSDNYEERVAAQSESDLLNDDLLNIAKVVNPGGEAGRAFNILRTMVKIDPDYGLKIKQSALLKSKGNEPLTAEEKDFVKNNWEEEKQNIEKQNEAKVKSLQENFDKKLADLQKEYEAKLKSKGATITDKTTREKTLSQSGKELADKIRRFKSPKGALQTDITFGLRNAAVETVAQIVEQGSKLADAIKQVLQDEKFKGLNEEDLTNHLIEIANKKTPEETLQKIKDYIKEGGETDVTKEMVGKNLIKDYVESHIGEHDQKDILDKATEGLKEVLPDIDNQKLIEAYLKEGDYKQDTKRDLEGGIKEQKKQLQNIAKLEEDLKDLKGYSETRQRNFPTEREKSEYEQKLIAEKDSIIKSNKDRQNKLLEDNRKIESERNRQLKITNELKDKKAKLEQGIVEKKEKLERSSDTPEIEGLRKEVKDLEKGIRKAEAAQKAAERKIERDRNRGIKKDNKMVEAERNRQLQKVQDLTDKKEKLEKGIRDKKEKIPPKPDTPEIEYLKKQVSEVDKQLREGESRAKEIDRKIQANKDKNAELDANIKRAKAGQDIIKKFKNKSNKEVNEEVESKTRQLKKAINDNTPEDKVQDKLLQKAKDNAIKKTKEFQRRIDENDYEEPEPKTLNKSDAELIKLQKQQAKIEGEFRAKQDELRQSNKSNWEILADFVRSSFVAYWLRKPITLGKIIIATMVRPSVETITRKAFIPLIDKFFPGIAEAALAGGESSSTRSMMQGMKAYFNQMGEKGIERLAAKSEDRFQKADKEYQDYKKSDTPNNKKLEKLKKIRDERRFETLGNLVYSFIGGSSLKDALIAFVQRSNEIERQFGKVHSEGVQGENKITSDDSFGTIRKKLAKQILNGNVKTYEELKNYNPQGSVSKEVFNSMIDDMDYMLGFIGRAHSAAKTFSGRYSFASGFMARIESAVQKGEPLNSDRILEIAHESYFDWDSGKYQQGNPISDGWNRWLRHMASKEGKTGKIFKGLLGTEVAIQRIPVNMLIEEIKEYTLGAFTSVYKAAKISGQIKSELAGEGLLKDTKEFKDALHERLSELDGQQAATIVRAFRKGTFGLGVYALVATLVGVKFGIFPHLGQKKKKPEDELKPGELNPGQVMFGKTRLGESASMLIDHQPALWPMFFGSGLIQGYHDNIKKGETTPQAVAKSFQTHANILWGDVPQLVPVEPFKQRSIDPIINYGIKEAFAAKHQGFNKEDEKDSTLKYYWDKGVTFTPFNPNTVEIPNKGKLSGMPQGKWEEYRTQYKATLKEELDNLKGNTFYVTKDGKVHTTEPEEDDYSEKILSELTASQLKKVIVTAEAKATKAAKEKLSNEN